MRRVLFAMLGIVLLGGALIAGGALVYAQRGGLGKIYTDGQSIRAEADAAPLRSILWRDPTPFGLPVDLRGASELQISASGDLVVFVRTDPHERLNLYQAQRTPAGWSDATPIDSLNTRDNELSPALSPDGQRMVFASDRTGGQGGFDLWVAQRRADGVWDSPVHAGAINSVANDYSGAFASGGEALYFTSDRVAESPAEKSSEADPSWAERVREQQARHDADIYAAPVLSDGGFGQAHRVDALCSLEDDLAPAFSSAGDFVYFASNRDGGVGGFDLYRARIVGTQIQEPRPLDAPVNTADDELDPMPWLDGFAVVYTRAAVGSPLAGLFESRSREVYLDRDVFLAQRHSAAMWETLLPWLLGLVLLALLLALLAGLLKASRNERLARGWRRLSLLAKCILASIVVHMLLLLITAVWQVSAALGDYFQRPRGTRVALLDRGVAGGAGDLAQQVNAPMTQASDSAAELAQQARADVMLRPQSSIDTRQMNAETIEAQLAAATSAVDAREAAPTTMNDAPAPASVQVAQAQRDAQVTTPTAPRARAQSEAQGAAPAPRSTSAPQQAPMRDLASAEMMGASMQPQEAAQQIVSGRATLQAESARVATRIDPAEVAERGTLQTAELQARSDVRTPAAARASEAMEAVRPALASAAVSPEARPAPPAGQMASGRMASETLAPARTRQSVAGANVQVTAQDATEAVVDMPVLTRAPSIGVQGEANVQASVSSPGAGLDASVRHPVVEAAVALDAAAPASELSKSPAPMGSVVSSSQQGVATAMLTPAMTQQPVDAGALSRTQPSEVVMAAVASDWQPSTIDAPRMNEQARVQAPSGQAAQQQAALVEEASGPATVDAQSLEQLRPDVLHRAMSTGAEPVRARAFGAATRSSEVLSQSVDVEVAPSSLAHIPSQSELVLRDTPGLPVLGGTVLRAPGAVTSGMPSSSEVVAAEAVVVDALSPDFTSRPALAPAGHPSMSPTAALRLEPMATNTAALRVDRVEVASPMGAAAPDLSGPAVEVQLAMTDVAPPALRIPEAPREPQMYPQREEQARKELVEQGGGSAETEAAVADALRWLAANQQPDGRWSGRAFDDKCQCGGRSAYDFDKALTGLSLLCFLATDNTHMKPGPYQGQVARALNWLVAQQREDGSLFYDESMYSHGIATIALCEAYGMSGDAALREPVEKAVAFIVRARNDVQGGWRYEPGQPGDTSVLGWQVMAMQSARKCGIDVPEAALDNARSWLDKVALEGRPGLYAYQVGAPVSMSMTAEGMFVRQLLGMGQGDPRMDQSAQFILRELPDWERNANTYGWYYATLALYQHHGAAWEQWNARLSEQLVGAQRQDGTAAGSWDPSDRWSTIGGRVYQTAICCLTLEVYYRYLPRFIEES